MAKNRYKIAGGVWVSPEGTRHYGNEIIETDQDLHLAHPSKFIKLGEQQPEKVTYIQGKTGKVQNDGTSPTPPSKPNWRDTPIEQMELEGNIVNALSEAELVTAGQVADFDERNKGLTGLSGIGQASEKNIRAAIEILKA